MNKMMIVLITILTPILSVVSCIASTFFGGVAGWIVGLAFEDINLGILGILAQLGITNVTMFQVGAFLGFVTSFLTENIKISK